MPVVTERRPVPFVILMQARTGSTYLVEALHAHPNVEADYEVMSTWRERGVSPETQLEMATDPTRPVRVVLLGIGPDVVQNELNAIAQRTGGRAFSVQDPRQIGTIFLQALLRPGS